MLRGGFVLVMWAGCAQSAARGEFVSDVRLAGTTLVVSSCGVTVNIQTNYYPHGRDTTERAEANDCTYDRHALPDDSTLVRDAPEGCARAVELWQASVEGRPQLWRTLPRPCRAYLEELAR